MVVVASSFQRATLAAGTTTYAGNAAAFCSIVTSKLTLAMAHSMSATGAPGYR